MPNSETPITPPSSPNAAKKKADTSKPKRKVGRVSGAVPRSMIVSHPSGISSKNSANLSRNLRRTSRLTACIGRLTRASATAATIPVNMPTMAPSPERSARGEFLARR